MIAILFILILLGIAVVLTATTGSSALPVFEILILCALFCLFFGSGVYIAAAIGILGLLVGFIFSDRPFWLFIGQITWGASTNFVFVAVPLFLLMGEILLRTGLSERLYRALGLWLNRWPGGLLHTNIASCAVFSAISGSSVATAATMGSVALPYFANTRYDQRMVLGSLAAGGALGNLIPPGITFIVYALLTETSVGKLYTAAIVPGILVTLLFLVVIFVHGLRQTVELRPMPVPLREKLRGLIDLLPTVALIVIVLGSLYGGLATASEAAALGVTASLVFAALGGRLTWQLVHSSAIATARNTTFIGLILFGAYVLSYVLTSLRVPQTLAHFVTTMPLPPWALMATILLFYLALGTFMEGFSMVITTIPVVFPIVVALGYDPIWFGVMVTMLIEIAMITPPDGTVMYVLQGLRSTPGPITDIFSGIVPFITVYVLAVGLLLAFPGLALWLPNLGN